MFCWSGRWRLSGPADLSAGLGSPDGKPFYSTGTDVFSVPKEAAGRERTLRIVAGLRRAGFNSLAGWSSISSWAPVLDDMLLQGQTPPALFHALQAGTMKAEFDCLAVPGGKFTPGAHGFADPFDPRYEQALRSRVRDYARDVRDEPWSDLVQALGRVQNRFAGR